MIWTLLWTLLLEASWRRAARESLPVNQNLSFVDNLHVRNGRSFKEYMRRCADRNPSGAGELPVQKFCRKLKAFEADTRGNVTIMSGLAITMLLAFASLGAEYGAGLLLQSENQRIANSAAFIAASLLRRQQPVLHHHDAEHRDGDRAKHRRAQWNPRRGRDALHRHLAQRHDGRRSVADQGQHHQAFDDHPDRRRAQLSLIDGSILRPDRPSGLRRACVIALSASGVNASAGAGGISFSGGASFSAPNCGVATNNTMTVAMRRAWLTAKTLSYDTTAPTPTRAAAPT